MMFVCSRRLLWHLVRSGILGQRYIEFPEIKVLVSLSLGRW